MLELYCKKCHNTRKTKLLPKKYFIKSIMFSFPIDAYQCPTCKSVYLDSLEKAWDYSKAYYRGFLGREK